METEQAKNPERVEGGGLEPTAEQVYLCLTEKEKQLLSNPLVAKHSWQL